MCLFVTITPPESGTKRSHVKRLLKAASPLSAYPVEEDDRVTFLISNAPHCACDLHAAGPDALGAGIELDPGACDSLGKIALALSSAGLVPFEFRVFWADQRAREVLEMHVDAFRSLLEANSFNGGVLYVVSAH